MTNTTSAFLLYNMALSAILKLCPLGSCQLPVEDVSQFLHNSAAHEGEP